MSNFNEHTGHNLVSKPTSDAYKSGYDIVTAKQLMVDPPSGWMYGFPALWDKTKHETLEEFLRTKGYPEKDVSFACSYCRMWLPTPDDNA